MAVLIVFVCSSPVEAQDDGRSNEYRFTVEPYHNISGDLTGSGQFGYGFNPEQRYQRIIAEWPDLNYKVYDWFQLLGGLNVQYRASQIQADTLTLRPFFGPKFYLPNPWNWQIYNYTRYEFLDTWDAGSGNWSNYQRIRSRFGVQFPLASLDRAWQPKTWYGLADVEPFYRFDHETIDPIRLRAGAGYIVNDRIRIEFIYTAQFGRQIGGGLEYNENIFQMNIRVGLAHGIINRALNENPDKN